MARKEEIGKRDEELLARLGYKQELKREFTPLEVFGVAFSIIGLFPSMASVLVYALPNGGPAVMVWGWAVACIFIFCIGLAIAELGSAAPTAGGVYFWTYTLSSPHWRNLLSWVVGYANTVGYIAAIVRDSLSDTSRMVNSFRRLNDYLINGVAYHTVNGWSSGFAFILSFLAPLWSIGLCSGHGRFAWMGYESSSSTNAIADLVSTSAINVSLTFCMGTDIEYLLSSPIGQPMAQIFFNSFGQKGTLILWSFVVIAQYVLIEAVLAASRQAFAFSRDGALPFSSTLCRVNKSTHTPINAVWFVVISAALLGLLAFVGTQAINAVFAITVNALYIAYATPIVARWLGDNNFEPGPFNLGNLSLPVAMIAVSFMVFMNIVFFFPQVPTVNGTNMNYTVVVLCCVLVLSLVWYYLPVYGGVHWFTGPVPNIDKGLDIMEIDAAKRKESVGDGDVEKTV
ncbi:hypothetical protein ID866_7617 [Astraeus odoratus]|nr:hypothetical protein ID866_7617 [Astraeus odoratus]